MDPALFYRHAMKPFRFSEKMEFRRVVESLSADDRFKEESETAR